MKINARNITITFLLIMSFTSYVFLSSVEVNAPSPMESSTVIDQNEKEASANKIFLPDLTLVKQIANTINQALKN